MSVEKTFVTSNHIQIHRTNAIVEEKERKIVHDKHEPVRPEPEAKKKKRTNSMTCHLHMSPKVP